MSPMISLLSQGVFKIHHQRNCVNKCFSSWPRAYKIMTYWQERCILQMWVILFDSHSSKAFMMLHSLIHIKSDRSNCGKNEKRELESEKFNSCLLSHLCTSGQSLRECWIVGFGKIVGRRPPNSDAADVWWGGGFRCSRI